MAARKREARARSQVQELTYNWLPKNRSYHISYEFIDEIIECTHLLWDSSHSTQRTPLLPLKGLYPKEFGKFLPRAYTVCIPQGFIPGLALSAISNFSWLLRSLPSTSLSSFLSYPARTSSRDLDVTVCFLISLMWTPLRSATCRVTGSFLRWPLHLYLMVQEMQDWVSLGK